MLNKDIKESNQNFNLCGYEELAIAVVKCAATDYERALRRLSRYPHDIGALRVKDDCERFFQNEIEMYTTVDGTMLMKRIQDKVRKG